MIKRGHLELVVSNDKPLISVQPNALVSVCAVGLCFWFGGVYVFLHVVPRFIPWFYGWFVK